MSNDINMTPSSTVGHNFTSQTSVVAKENTAVKKDVETKNTLAENAVTNTAKVTQEIVEEKDQQISDVELEKALEIVSSFINTTAKHVNFSSDSSSGKMVITVIDRETQEIIQQFPSEKIVSMAVKIQDLHQEVESISGLLIDSRI